ncbi:arylsulfatase [Alteromonas sp. 14N.309.X.WAT.G.H12]|uniref:arylsulfatase n=1 Tax=Alteromonas sp. 14N.309.X.WAT.G.H12 TaxID=3120824 RepID=UPI002FCE7BDB
MKSGICNALLRYLTVCTSSFLLMFCYSSSASSSEAPKEQTKPNILLIVADDMGYSDLGIFGGEINTPNIDALAQDGGVQLTNFHSAPTCSPTRSMLMSGTYNHVAGLGAMAEWLADNQRGKPGYEGYLNERVAPLPSLMKDAGYATFMAGKWHLGMKKDQLPNARGFDESFAMLPGAGNHYSDKGIFPFLPKTPYTENDKPVKLPKDFYSTTFYTDKVISYIDSVQKKGGKPFFGYVAYTAPHWPLQVDEKYSDKYKGKYDVGYDAIQAKRIEKMRKLGLINDDTTIAEGNRCYLDWATLSDEEKKRQARLMEIYAGMVDALDENIGRLIQHLKDTGQFDNTLIVFLSDNGADARPENGLGGENKFLEENYDNRFENLGSGDSFVSYGGAWARVSNTPLSLHKGMTTEGAIRVPAIMHLPKGMRVTGIKDEFVSVMDLLPTFLDLAGGELPNKTYKNHDVVEVKGESVLPYLLQNKTDIHKDDPYGFSVHRRQGLQFNDWKIVRIPAPYSDGNWHLYNLAEDMGETHDLAATKPKVLADMISKWDAFAKETGVIISQEDAKVPNECPAIQ